MNVQSKQINNPDTLPLPSPTNRLVAIPSFEEPICSSSKYTTDMPCSIDSCPLYMKRYPLAKCQHRHSQQGSQGTYPVSDGGQTVPDEEAGDNCPRGHRKDEEYEELCVRCDASEIGDHSVDRACVSSCVSVTNLNHQRNRDKNRIICRFIVMNALMSAK